MTGIDNTKHYKTAVVRTDRIGDMVLTLPLCKAIKSYNPNIDITVIANSYTEPLLTKIPEVDNSVFIDSYQNGINGVFEDNKFDIAFFPRPVFSEVRAAFTAGIPLRVGTAFRWYSFLFNHKVKDHRKKGNFHEVEYNVRLLSSLTDLEHKVELIKPHIEDTDISVVQGYLSEFGINSNDELIIIHPGTKGSAAEWDINNFRKLALKLSALKNKKILVTGTVEEFDKCNWVAGASNSILNLCDKLSLSQMTALLSISKLLVANSTGVVHLAAAIGTNVISLYPNTSHISGRRWGPYSDNSIVISPPLSHNKKEVDDLNRIQVNEVLKAAKQFL